MLHEIGTPKQLLNLDALDFPQWAFTEKNEQLIRQEIFAVWQTYFAKRRKNYLARLTKLEPNSVDYHKLSQTKFVRLERPTDLSGACKITAQVAYVVFPLDGRIISNSHHTFVVLKNGDIYDMNRNCADVGRLAGKGKRPYKISVKYSNSDIAVKGRQSWHDLIATILARLDKLSNAADAPVPVTKLPKWARSKYLVRA